MVFFIIFKKPYVKIEFSCVIKAFYTHKFYTDKRPDPQLICSSYKYLSRVGIEPMTGDTEADGLAAALNGRERFKKKFLT